MINYSKLSSTDSGQAMIDHYYLFAVFVNDGAIVNFDGWRPQKRNVPNRSQ